MYPVNLQMKGMPCLIIGGGHVALRKIKKLLKEEALVTVLAPEICEEIQKLVEMGALQWISKAYQVGDAQGYRLVVTACGVRAVAEQVHAASQKEYFLYNASDFPPLGNCQLPAAFETGGMQFTVSTQGRSPAMAKYVKEWLMRDIPSGFGDWLDRVSRIRQEVKKDIHSSQSRENFWHAVFDDSVMHLVMEGKIDEAEECVRHAIGRFRTEP